VVQAATPKGPAAAEFIRGISISALWQGAPGSNRYTGDIDNFGAAYGTVLNQDGGTSDWSAHEHFKCADAPKPAEPPPPANPGAPSKTAFVGIPGTDQDEDVDVYDTPGGKGKVLGILGVNKGVQVNADCQPNTWCLVRGAAVPSGQGWIWGHLRFE
jgi:hypothetical protein